MSDNNGSTGKRTCATCACALLVKHPIELNVTQLVCRKNGLMLASQQVEGPGGKVMVQTGLTYPPTRADSVCFNDWRPIGVQPGDKWRQEAMIRALGPVFMDAAQKANLPPELVTALQACLADSDAAWSMLAAPPDTQKN